MRKQRYLKKRGIAGTLVFTVFDRDALLEEFAKEQQKITTFNANYLERDTAVVNALSIDDWDAHMNGSQVDTKTNTKTRTVVPKYADEILPFDVTITFANEYGQKASITIYGVELLNEGSGYSVDTVTTEKAYTFVARSISPMTKIDAGETAVIESDVNPTVATKE